MQILKYASSFSTEALAEEAIAAALHANEAGIRAWLSSGSKRLYTVEANLDKQIGIKLMRGAKSSAPCYAVRAVLSPKPLAPLGYFVLTGYPI